MPAGLLVMVTSKPARIRPRERSVRSAHAEARDRLGVPADAVARALGRAHDAALGDERLLRTYDAWIQDGWIVLGGARPTPTTTTEEDA
jgi:hypothetical protein